MRLFTGLALPPPIAEELLSFTLRLRAADDGLRWSAMESWHVTVQFLGAATGEQYDCLVSQLRQLESAAVPVGIRGSGFFDRAGIFYAGVEISPQLASLHQLTMTRSAACGFQPESRPYRPHITLARVRGRKQGRPLQELKTRLLRPLGSLSFTAAELLLYESIPGPAGSAYVVRECFALTPRPV